MLRAPVRVRFVCSGNICRSPTAETVLRAQARDSGRSALVEVSSAGTGPWHVGEDMDRRSRSTLEQGGYAVAGHVAQQFDVSGFTRHDLVVALDGGHLSELRAMADRTPDPSATRDAIVLLREFDPQLHPGEDPDVGDPYYGGESGFVDVLAQIERSCAALLDAIEHAVRTGADVVSAQRQDESDCL
jgi:low molecular weight protein-tyrosine phosphatase